MIKLTPYAQTSDSFLNKVINSKNRGEYKERIILLKPRLLPCYTRYDNAFNNNALDVISVITTFTPAQKDDLIKLYKYSSKPFIELKNNLLTLPNGRGIDTCQYCTINSVNTLDHIIPKNDYPEYIIHPKNLFPVCSQCNSKKNTTWLTKNNEFEFLNLYTHDLPLVQYLFANVQWVNNTFEVDFQLQNNGHINENLFEVIKRHYHNLDLLTRFKLKSHEVITNFENSIISHKDHIDLATALTIALSTIRKNQAVWGVNHWEQVLCLELINGAAFRNYCHSIDYY